MGRRTAAIEKIEALRYSLDQFTKLQRKPEARFHWRSAIAELNSLVKLLLSLAKEDRTVSGQIKALRSEWETDALWKFLKALRHESEHSESRDTPKLAKHRPAHISIAGIAEVAGGSLSVGKVNKGGVDFGGAEASIKDGVAEVETASPNLASLVTSHNAQVDVPHQVMDKKGNTICVPSSVADSADPAAYVAQEIQDLVDRLTKDFDL